MKNKNDESIESESKLTATQDNRIVDKKNSLSMIPPVVSNREMWGFAISVGAIFTIIVGGLGLVGGGPTHTILIQELVGWALVILGITGGFFLAFIFIMARLKWLIDITKGVHDELRGPIHLEALSSLEKKLIGPKLMEDIHEKLKETTDLFKEVQDENFKEIINNVIQSGLTRIHPIRHELSTSITQQIRDAKEEVVFVGVSISTVLHMPGFDRIAENAINKNNKFKYRFLFLKSTEAHNEDSRNASEAIPSGLNFDFLEQRAQDEGAPITSESLKENAAALKEYLEDLDAKFKLKMGIVYKNNIRFTEYEAYPYLSLIIIDDVMFVGPYLYGTNCANSPMFEFKRKSNRDGAFSSYYLHYMRLWESFGEPKYSGKLEGINTKYTDEIPNHTV